MRILGLLLLVVSGVTFGFIEETNHWFSFILGTIGLFSILSPYFHHRKEGEGEDEVHVFSIGKEERKHEKPYIPNQNKSGFRKELDRQIAGHFNEIEDDEDCLLCESYNETEEIEDEDLEELANKQLEGFNKEESLEEINDLFESMKSYPRSPFEVFNEIEKNKIHYENNSNSDRGSDHDIDHSSSSNNHRSSESNFDSGSSSSSSYSSYNDSSSSSSSSSSDSSSDY